MLAGRSKYGSKKTVVNGDTFDSQKEAARWQDLLLLQRAGKIEGLRRQVKFELTPKTGEERSMSYVADFVYTEGGRLIAEDVKGMKTRGYIDKRKMFRYRYPEYIFRET